MNKTQRLKKGEYLAMTDEQKKQHKRDLQKDWRARHPEWVKSSNKYWAKRYAETKPFICICERCRREFFYSRKKGAKYCVLCREEMKRQVEEKKRIAQEKRIAKINRYAEIIRLHKLGYQQAVIAEMVGGITQNGVSRVLRALLPFVARAKKRNLKK